ncbi:DUF6492 family protein [Lacrimispora sp. 210928-DFI.3.58]|uniref:DUF6492 family protein n=1 Tax=Lacrimispora sp. 210928-DFI.3.58 TaxID=2883214 RepID=UPI001D090711|nr:DUF6492 family protein [Lacrimispora sp. 210928-DFI.3.58]
MNDYNVIIMVTEDHLPMMEKMIPFCKQNISPKRIYVVAASKIQQKIEAIEDVIFIDEDQVYDGLNYSTVMNLMEKRTGERKRAGWYLQQFLKMAWSYKCEEKCYIVLDADTFVLNPIGFTEQEKYCFTPKCEYHQPYFDTIKKLFQGSIYKKAEFSFIAENMIFDCAIMRQMISEIEGNALIEGDTFFEKIIHSIKQEDLLGSGFSEFETYGNYIYIKYPDLVKARKLRTMRESLVLLGGNPSAGQLKWASNDYDIISVESIHYKRTLVTWLTSKEWFRRRISMKKLAQIRHKIRTVYRRLLRKEDFVFEEY